MECITAGEHQDDRSTDPHGQTRPGQARRLWSQGGQGACAERWAGRGPMTGGLAEVRQVRPLLEVRKDSFASVSRARLGLFWASTGVIGLHEPGKSWNTTHES